MKKEIAIIGGDLRIVYLAELLAKDGFEVNTFALEKMTELHNCEKIKNCQSLKETVQRVDTVISAIPLSSDRIYVNTPYSDLKLEIQELYSYLKGKKFIAGKIENYLHCIEIYDILQNEEYAILNAIATAEGAIKIAIEETKKTLLGANILIMGFGRIGKILAKMLQGIGANVFCEARKNADLAYIKAYGYTPIHLKELDKYLNKFDIIINNIPTEILDKNRLNLLKKDVLIIDLASKPGGVDFDYAKRENIKVVWALGLPGKVAPVSCAKYIRKILYDVFKIDLEKGM